MGEEIELEPLKFTQPFTHAEMNILKEVAGENEFELCRELISIEQSYKNELRRHQLFQEMEKSFKQISLIARRKPSNTPKRFSAKNKNIKRKLKSKIMTPPKRRLGYLYEVCRIITENFDCLWC